jgi:lysozyme
MKVSKDGLELIKASEGCRLKAYKCSAGVWTIGYGSTGEHVYEGLEISQKEADTLLALDVGRFERAVSKTCPKISQPQFDACVSLAYNIGAGAFAKSSVARLHNAGKYAEAGQAFMLWNKAGGKVSRGLTSRRAKESALYLSDQIGDDYVPPSYANGEKPLSSSKTINGTVGAGVATAATAAVANIDTATITENSGLILTFLPYLKEYWWVLVAVGGGFLALSVYARVKDRLEGRA